MEGPRHDRWGQRGRLVVQGHGARIEHRCQRRDAPRARVVDVRLVRQTPTDRMVARPVLGRVLVRPTRMGTPAPRGLHFPQPRYLPMVSLFSTYRARVVIDTDEEIGRAHV